MCSIIQKIALPYQCQNKKQQQYFMKVQHLINHHSLSKKNSIFSRHSLEDSAPLSKKMSASSLKNYVDIDRLIDDIKLAPHKQGQAQQHIKNIGISLVSLREVPGIVDEVRTIELLLESITKKLTSEALSNTRLKHTQSLQRDSSIRRSNVSPVKQFDEGSRIVYANFSIKEMMSLPHQQLQTPIKRYNDMERERDETDQMDKLNSEILILEKMLKSKGVASSSVKKIDNQIHMSSTHHFSRGEQMQNSNSKTKVIVLNKENATAPKKYSLLQKTQQINLARPKQNQYDRNKLLRGENHYR